jgi:sugar/nucleoside kinase (ribokinase family)
VTVALVGNLSLDRVAGAAPRVGGAVHYGSLAAARIDADVRVAARCAVADRAVALEPVLATGLPVAWGPSDVTTSFAFHYEGERRVMAVTAVADPWRAADVAGWAAATLQRATWVHVGALLRSDFDADTLAAIAASGAKLLVDAQGLVRLGRMGPLTRDADVGDRVLTTITALKLNESEARLLAGGVTRERLRALGVPEVVLTLGSSGSLVVTAGTAERIAAEPVDVPDPTGAGDTYALGYAVARAAGADPVEAGRSASMLVGDVLAARR